MIDSCSVFGAAGFTWPVDGPNRHHIVFQLALFNVLAYSFGMADTTNVAIHKSMNLSHSSDSC